MYPAKTINVAPHSRIFVDPGFSFDRQHANGLRRHELGLHGDCPYHHT